MSRTHKLFKWFCSDRVSGSVSTNTTGTRLVTQKTEFESKCKQLVFVSLLCVWQQNRASVHVRNIWIIYVNQKV